MRRYLREDDSGGLVLMVAGRWLLVAGVEGCCCRGTRGDVPAAKEMNSFVHGCFLRT